MSEDELAKLRRENDVLREACAFAIGALDGIEGERAQVAKDELIRRMLTLNTKAVK